MTESKPTTVKPGEAPPAPGEVSVNWQVQCRVWFAIFWRSAAILFVMAVVIEVGMREMFDLPRVILIRARDVATWLIIPITLWASGKALNKTFGRYRLAVIDMQPDLAPSRVKKEKKPVDKKASKPQKKRKDAASQPNETNTKS